MKETWVYEWVHAAELTKEMYNMALDNSEKMHVSITQPELQELQTANGNNIYVPRSVAKIVVTITDAQLNTLFLLKYSQYVFIVEHKYDKYYT